MDIIKIAQDEINIYERPSVQTSKKLMEEVIALRRKIKQLKQHAYDCCHEEMQTELDDRITELNN